MVEPAAEREGGGAMFDRIARRYDRMNRILSFGMDRSWRRRLVAALEVEEGEVLDLATGTADVALEIARRLPESRVVGLDPSAGMLAVGRRKVAEAGLEDRIVLVEGDAQSLPFEGSRFAAASMAFGIRNVPERRRALAEMARVVRPGGRVVILELSEPRGTLLAPFARFHVHHVVPRLGAWLSRAPEYRYLQRSIQAFPPPEAFAKLMAEAGLAEVSAEAMLARVAHLYTARAPS